jgi:outer membrane immunogenic protein
MYACLRMSLVATALMLTSIVANVSNAADIPRAPVRSPLATIYDWTGFYAGGHVGGGWVGDGDGGFLGGGQVGFNFQSGPWVYGVEADASAASGDLNWTSTLAGRFGWAVDRWMVYGKVGGAWANVDEVRMQRVSDRTSSGLLLGVGAEYALQNNWTAKVEYNRMNVDHDVDVVKFGLNYRFGLNPLPGRW